MCNSINNEKGNMRQLGRDKYAILFPGEAQRGSSTLYNKWELVAGNNCTVVDPESSQAQGNGLNIDKVSL